MVSIALVAAALSGCGERVDAPIEMSPDAAAYLADVLELLQQHSVNRYKTNWPRLRTLVLARAASAQTPNETYDAIRFALQELRDNHSFFLTPGEEISLPLIEPTGRRVAARIGLISVPGFLGSGMTEFANQLQAIVSAVDTASLCGWIVDLRANLGGNMWPMLAGLGPLLGDGTAGAFVDPNGLKQEWWYRGGIAGLDPYGGMVRVTPPLPYTPIRPNPPVAVLTSDSTKSAGEAIVASFRGRPNTRSFGQLTRGKSTSTRSFKLKDGATVVLATATLADRSGRLYGGPIAPDSIISNGGPNDAPLAGAMTWLDDQPDCRRGEPGIR